MKYMSPAPVSIDFNLQMEYNEWFWMTLVIDIPMH